MRVVNYDFFLAVLFALASDTLALSNLLTYLIAGKKTTAPRQR
jgi:hypothetical protein